MDSTTRPKLGLRIKREQAGLSRAQLAARAGCSPATILNLEMMPSEAMARRLADAIGCDPADLYEVH